MMINNSEWEQLIQGVRDGDDLACQQFWDLYGPMLEKVADRHLASGVRRRVGPDSVVISACRTFFRRAKSGEYDLPDAEALWRLLSAITINKVRMKARFHLQKKRGLAAETHPENFPDVPSFEQASEQELAECLEDLMHRFDAEEKQILDLKLQLFTNDEIAAQLKCSERTIRRIMQRVKSRLITMIDVESDSSNDSTT